MISISDEKSAYRAIPIFVLATAFCIGISAFLSRSVFGAPIVTMSGGTASCLSVQQYSGVVAPAVSLSLSLNVKLEAPLGSSQRSIRYIRFGVLYSSDLEPKSTLEFANHDLSGALLTVNGVTGGDANYDTEIPVSLSGSINSNVGYLLAYEAAQGDFKALITADVYFDCDAGSTSGCRRVVWRSTKTINSAGVPTAGC